MNIKNLLKIKKQVQETDELLGDSNKASIAMANNYINAVKNHIELYKNTIKQLPNKISKIPDNVLQDTIEYLVRNNINQGNYQLNYILNLPTLIIHNEYDKYTHRYVNNISDGTNFTFSVAFNNDIDNIELFERNSDNNLFNIHLPIMTEKATKTLTYNSYFPDSIDSIEHINFVLNESHLISRYILVESSDNEKIYNIIDKKELDNIMIALENRLTDFGYKLLFSYNRINITEDAELTDDMYIKYLINITVINPIKYS